MKADQIIRNARIFTSDRDCPQATALAVKDGKFVYVGDEAGLSMYEGRGWTGGLIGGLAGLLGGPVGVLVGMCAGALIGNAADETGM